MKPKNNADYLKEADERTKDVKGSHVNYGQSEPKDGNIKSKLFLLLLVLAMGLFLGAYAMKELTPKNPLGQYINTRTCEFISMGGFQSAVCSDGTSWSVSPFQQ